MDAGGIHAHVIVVAVQRDPAAGAAGGVAVSRGDTPGDPLGRIPSTPASGNLTEAISIGLLNGRLGVPRTSVLTNNLAVTGLAEHDVSNAARLWGREYFAHIVCQAGVLRPWIAPPVIGRVLSQAGTGPEIPKTVTPPTG